ncbi:amidohydrolase [Azotosporobacter soli]|uniref:M20 metallopeptidase family protein n=1 Tax=Azotosporobacter soli TaxID=3055040 RepID=UPI0031FECD7F
MEQKIAAAAAANKDYVIELRRHFRMHPELSGAEFETQKRISQELQKMGIEAKAIAKTGIIAEIKGEKPGPCVALRADIDALPLADEINAPYRSQRPGVCHACGHDGHTAMLLGVAKGLVTLREELPGTIRLLFQPSEEAFPGGAQQMIEAGALEGVAAIIGAHLWQDVPAGCVGVTYGAMMASPDEFKIIVQGRGGHGSMPYQTVDPIHVGAQIVLALRGIVANDLGPKEPAVVSIGLFQAGEVFNVIPDTALLRGTVRSFSQTVREKVFARIEQICAGLCAAAGAGYRLEPIYGFPPVINDPAIAAVLADSARQVVAAQKVLEIDPVMGGEDFSCYQAIVPGAFVFIGSGNPDKGICHPHHHPKFEIDEDVLPIGVEVLSRTALRLLTRK